MWRGPRLKLKTGAFELLGRAASTSGAVLDRPARQYMGRFATDPAPDPTTGGCSTTVDEEDTGRRRSNLARQEVVREGADEVGLDGLERPRSDARRVDEEVPAECRD